MGHPRLHWKAETAIDFDTAMDQPDSPSQPGRQVGERLARRARLALAALVLVAGLVGGSCGSKSTPTSPTSSSSSPPTLNACGIINGTTSQMLGILNGSTCSETNTSVVMLNLRASDGSGIGQCSGTIIAPRAVLTAAHCLVDSSEPVATVKVYLGRGSTQLVATSFQASPLYSGTNTSSVDVGVVLTGEDMNRPALPLLLSREAATGEQAVIAGWGQDRSGSSGTLRAGTTTISAVGNYYLQTQISASASGVCNGDSGGPLLLSQGGAWALAGVTSATSTNACTSGTDYYARLRNPDIMSFVLGLVPDATQR